MFLKVEAAAGVSYRKIKKEKARKGAICHSRLAELSILVAFAVALYGFADSERKATIYP